MAHHTARAQVIQGALIGALFLAFVGFNVGFIKGGPGNSSREDRIDPSPADQSSRLDIRYGWELPLAALACLGEALLGAAVGAAVAAVARHWFGERGARMAVILLGAIGGALLGYSVGGSVAAERVVVFSAPLPGRVGVTTTAAPNAMAALVTTLLGAVMGSPAGRGASDLCDGPRRPADEPRAETVEPADALPRA